MRMITHRRRRLFPAAAVIVAVAGLGAYTVLTAATASAATGQITGFAGKCADVAGANPADGTIVQLYTCNGTNAQQWSRPGDGTVRALGKCLDVSGGSTANGARVQLWTCNGTGAQQWVYTSGQNLVNPQANMCLDVTGVNSADGTPLQMWTCTGAANQKWNVPAAGGGGGGTPGIQAAPYEYLGWGSPPNPTSVMNATGIRWFTLAFVLSNGYCNPAWDGARPLTGGTDQSTINAIRAAGGDIVVSFGGWSGNKLGENCNTAGELANAYQRVINAYQLKAIDIDIENTEMSNPTVRQRVIDALKTIGANNPGIVKYLTMGTGQSGPVGDGADLIRRGAASGLALDAWVIMPFDFGGGNGNMGTLTVQAAEGLKNAVKSAYGYSDDTAYRHSGISSMNGKTDNAGEQVNVSDLQTILGYAQQHHLARFTFWSVNRDRACGGATTTGDSCSGVAQQQYDYTRVVARYLG